MVTLIIGGVIGWLASILMKANGQMGIVAKVIVGVVGSYVGVALANALGLQANTGRLRPGSSRFSVQRCSFGFCERSGSSPGWPRFASQ